MIFFLGMQNSMELEILNHCAKTIRFQDTNVDHLIILRMKFMSTFRKYIRNNPYQPIQWCQALDNLLKMAVNDQEAKQIILNVFNLIDYDKKMIDKEIQWMKDNKKLIDERIETDAKAQFISNFINILPQVRQYLSDKQIINIVQATVEKKDFLNRDEIQRVLDL